MGAVVGAGSLVGRSGKKHAILVQAKPTFMHMHWLQKLDPVSFPVHPSSTNSLPVKLQVLFSCVALGIIVGVGIIGTLVGVEVKVGRGVTAGVSTITWDSAFDIGVRFCLLVSHPTKSKVNITANKYR